MSKSKIKTLLSYQLRDYRNTILIMYLCVYLAVIALLIFDGTNNSGNSSTGGFEWASMITIFVVGLNSFKENFKFFSANGVSRKTQLFSTTTALGILAGMFAFIDTINSVIFTPLMAYRPAFIEFYGPRFGYDLNLHAPYTRLVLTPQMLIESFLWFFCAYFCLSMIGLFITTLYYRMNKGLKIAVSIAVPTLFLSGIPQMLDCLYFGGIFTKFFVNALNAAWGFSSGYNPYIGMISMLVFTAVFTALAYLLARKANVKE